MKVSKDVKEIVAVVLGVTFIVAFVLTVANQPDTLAKKDEYRMVVPPGYDCSMVGDTVTCHKEVSHGDGFDRP